MLDVKTKRYGSENHFKRIYLVAPRHPDNFWSMQGTVELLGAKTLMPNAALATLMALTTPGIDVEYVLCDENVSALDWNMPCDLVAVTGATLHAKRIQQYAKDSASGVFRSPSAAPMPASTMTNAAILRTIISSARPNTLGRCFSRSGSATGQNPFITSRPILL